MCDQGGVTVRPTLSVQRYQSPGAPLVWWMGEWGTRNRFLANKSCTSRPWNVLESDLPILWVSQRAKQTLAETDRCWSGQGRACKTACNLSHHHHVLTKA